MKVACNICGSTEIRREASVMLNPNDEGALEDVILEGLVWGEIYFCVECGKETIPKEVEDNG